MENIDTEDLNNSAALLRNSTTERLNGGVSQFTIPVLKVPKLLGGSQELSISSPSSNINKFLLKQLKDEQNQIGQTTTTTTRFNVPQLKGGAFIIPELKIGQQATKQEHFQQKTTNVLDNSKTKHSFELLAKEKHRTDLDNIIDLTAALSTTNIGNNSNNKNIRGNQRNKEKSEQFEIPFIDCDRDRALLPPTNEYCGIDISNVTYKHKLVPPSALGKILSLKNSRIKSNLRKRTDEPRKSKLKPKHHVERFLFDTESPDDMVLAALNRFSRS